MEPRKKQERYRRIHHQLEELLKKSRHLDARLATIAALLHNKMEYFSWTGFYWLIEGELLVKTYQGPLACQLLEKNKGVCWSGINEGKTVIVPDVDLFPGHIACDSRSRSEIVIPVRDPQGRIAGVLDVDSTVTNAFDDTDAQELEKIVSMIFPSEI